MDSRTANSVRNSAVGMGAKLLAILAGYVTRIVLVRVLSADLVGVNGLLSNILFALTLPQLGLDTALVYFLYKPVALGELPRQRSLLGLYRRIYRITGLCVAGVCLLLWPLVRLLAGQGPMPERLPLMYGLYSLGTVLSFYFSYKRLLFLVHQRNFINELFNCVFQLGMSLFQCLVLLLTRSYILFLCVYVLSNALQNVAASRWAERCYPELWEGEAPGPDPEEKRSILRNIRAMLLHKSGAMVISNTDNLLLTWFFGLAAVGVYSNYYLIIGSVQQLMDRGVYGITASVGNLGATADRGQVGRVFRVSFLAAAWLYGLSAICLFLALEPFIRLSFGEAYLLPRSLTLVLCLNLYLNGVRTATLVFRDSLGLFWYDRFKTPAEALVNLLSSILLAGACGPIGVFLGTTVSILLVSFWVEPLVLYRRYLREPLLPYFGRYLLYFAIVLAAGAVSWLLAELVTGTPLAQLLLRLLIGAAVPNLLFLLPARGTWEFRLLREKVLNVLRRCFGAGARGRKTP